MSERNYPLMREYPATILRSDEAILRVQLEAVKMIDASLSLCMQNQCWNRGLEEKDVTPNPELVNDDDLLYRVAQLRRALQLWNNELGRLWRDYMDAAFQAERREEAESSINA